MYRRALPLYLVMGLSTKGFESHPVMHLCIDYRVTWLVLDNYVIEARQNIYVWNWVVIGSANGCFIFGTKKLHVSMLNYCRGNHPEQTVVKLKSR